ncbi:ATP-binding region ATPase domain protein [Gemmatirosa kalamazoonensis]|uniref:histidine kinase n=1 Tax=Gemmatirosa kalamazoonensis TaxID=861299 RepID=W0RHY5_9BACT|nr:HAMP domain-containing sensor histidine kinase [Gemmatirosa kalamazoonensis]AHG89023.1 ATP-binding region ATPase domain protein [Gemmatirosa kalamazoonensis]
MPSSSRASSVLWVAAALLGAAMLAASMAVVHDRTRNRAAARAVMLAVADQTAARASARLTALAAEMLAPAATSAVPNATAVGMLARAQREGERCRCRAVLPASAFFRLDAATGALDAATLAGPVAPPAVLVELARAEAHRAREPLGPTVHLVSDPRLGDDVLVTLIWHEAPDAARGVVGLVADARRTTALLFGHDVLRPLLVDPASALATLDSSSLAVTGAGGARLFGAIDATRGIRATVHPRGALDALTIAVALHAGQVAVPLGPPVPVAQLWQLGALQLGTVVVIVLAVSASRRETALERERADFVAGVSHDLRMPLAQILLAGETLAMDRARDAAERGRLASSVVREGRRLLALVENVLLFSRAGAVGLRPRRVTVPVRALLDDVAEDVRLAADDAGRTLVVDADASLAAHGDRDLLRQALVNLVDNALKYGGAGPVTLGASADGDRVRFHVDDAGAGVPRAERMRVFEPYERLSRDRASERAGTGLGLAVVRNIAQSHGGRVWLDDAPGGGTRAVIELPA